MAGSTYVEPSAPRGVSPSGLVDAAFTAGMAYADARQAAGIADPMGGAEALAGDTENQPYVPAEKSADGVT